VIDSEEYREGKPETEQSKSIGSKERNWDLKKMRPSTYGIMGQRVFGVGKRFKREREDVEKAKKI